MNILHMLLAILGLGFLVFIHELGHYFMAKRVGMRVEAFAIGFGRPLFKWVRHGVEWRLCWLPFGGYVKIAGMQKEGGVEPSDIPDGFFGKKPWARIKVAFMGPMVNLTFAFLAFTAIWMTGGRQKPFSEFTNRIGWVDPKSDLFAYGVRPGDQVSEFDGRKIKSYKDLVYASLTEPEKADIKGYKVDYYINENRPFNYTLETYKDEHSSGINLSTVGIMSPASYIIYKKPSNSILNSPMKDSGIQEGDRILWADGELIFSSVQLTSLVNQSTAFLTVQRGNQTFQTKVPRVKVSDLRLSHFDREEINDWKHEIGLKTKLQELFVIPYQLNEKGVVDGPLVFIDPDQKDQVNSVCVRCDFYQDLQKNDQIIAIDNIPINSAFDLLNQVQTRRVLTLVERDPSLLQPISWEGANKKFDSSLNRNNLEEIIHRIGSQNSTASVGNFHLLKPIVPKTIAELQPGLIQRGLEKISKIRNDDERSLQLKQFNRQKNTLALGIMLSDRMLTYNPNPLLLFKGALKETWVTFSSLLTGNLNPKWLSGPVGIIQVVHYSWSVGVKEAMFWLAFISLNLGIVNLLPIPVLDGGHICFSVFEMITRKPLKAKTMERLIIPFVVLLIGAFIFITYHDLSRLFWSIFR